MAYHFFMGKILGFFLKLVVVLVLFTAILFVLSKLVEQKIVEKAITILNNQLDVPVYVEDISFTLIKKFPNATLQLNNVTILSAKKFNRTHFNESYPDTLAFLKELYLSINLLSLINNQLDLTKAYAQNGQINILVDKKGKENYKILNKGQTKVPSDTSKNNFTFLLNQIQLKQVKFRFINKYKKTNISIYAPAYTLKGEFYKKEYSASSTGKLQLNYFEQGNFKIHPTKPANINIQLKVDNNQIQIVKSSIQAQGVQLLTNGEITLDNPIKVDLKITGTSNNIDELFTLFNKNNIYDFSTKGQLSISAVIKGVLNSKKSPAIAVNFKLANGSLSEKKHHLFLNKVELNGSYANGNKQNISTSQIIIKNFLIATDSSSVTGGIKEINFNNPLLTINAKTLINTTDLDSWIPNKPKYPFYGTIDGEFYCRGGFDAQLPLTLNSIKHWTKKGDFFIKGGMAKENQPKLNIKKLTGQLKIRENTLSFNNLKGVVQNNKITGNIIVDNFITPIIDSTSDIKISANFKTDRIHYNDYKYFFEDNKSKKPRGNGAGELSHKITITGSFEIDTFLYKKLIAKNVHGNMDYKNEQLHIAKLEFNTMGGTVKSQINYFPKYDNRYVFQTNTTTSNINIKSLFANFSNFGQTFIKYENIDGLLTSNFDLEMIYKNGKVEPPSIELLGHIRVENGKLTNFEPIREASKFSDIEELRHIEFSLLENDILISSSTVNIPKMEIVSNAFDISLYGTQKFSGDYKYHMRIYLSDFLGGKSKRLAKQQSEFGYIEDDGHGKKTLFLVATSKNNKTKVKLDGNEIKSNLKAGIKEEKKNFKKTLRDEFGWFKKDTTLNKDKKTEKKQEFIIEWDEE